MPAQSKSQQRFFGVVKAMQKGDIPKKGNAGKIAKTMSKDDVDDFASTKHKGKPEKVKREQRVRELIKKMVREELDEKTKIGARKTGPLSPKQSREVGSLKNYMKKNNPFREEDLEETTVRISTMKDVSFAGRDRLQLVGKKGKLGLDRKSVSALVKAVRSILGRSFTTHEQKLNEAKTITLPNGVKAKIEFKGITLQAKGKKPVFLDRTEMMTFFKATQKYMKQGLAAGKMSEGKYDRELIRLDNATAKEFGSWKSEVLKLSKLLPNSEKKKINKDIMTINKLVFNITKTFDKNLDEGTCGYGENGQLGEEPAGPHLIKKKKMKEEVEPIGGMAKIAKIVKDKQHAKVGGQTVDMQSANLLMKLYNAVKDKDKEKMNKMSEKKLIVVLGKLWSRVKLKLPT